jgi:nucleotide-binding universal stress UspA family protein
MEPNAPVSTSVRPERRRRVKVVGYDGSDPGRQVVEGAAARVGPGDRLIIVHVVEPAIDGAAETRSRYEQIRRRMRSMLDPALFDGIDYELRIVNGSPARALIDAAIRTQADAIVVGTRRAPSRLGQRTIRSELEAGPVPVVALFGRAEGESHPLGEPSDATHRHGYDSFPASDPPSSWAGTANGAHGEPVPERSHDRGRDR